MSGVQLELVGTAVLAIATSGQAGLGLVRRQQAKYNVTSARFRFTIPDHDSGDLRGAAVMQADAHVEPAAARPGQAK